jgi:hypothetical protein
MIRSIDEGSDHADVSPFTTIFLTGDTLIVAETRAEILARIAEANTDQKMIERLKEDCQRAYAAVAVFADHMGFWDSMPANSRNAIAIDNLLDNLNAAAEGQPRPHPYETFRLIHEPAPAEPT